MTPRSHSRLTVQRTLCLSWTTEGRVQSQLDGPPGTQAFMVAVSPDGSRLAVIWNGPTGWALTLDNPVRTNPWQPSARDVGFTWALAFSPDGTRIATAGEDGLTRLWDTSTGALTAECRGHTRKVLSVAFRPDGRRVVTASADGAVRQWDPASGREVEAPYERHTGEVVTAAYSPDGLWVASGGTDRTIRVWGAADRHDVAVLHGHTGAVSDLAFSADGRRLASTSQSGTIGYTRMARCGSGRSAVRRARPCCAATPATSIRWHTARTDNGSPRELGRHRTLVGRSDW